MGMMILKIQEGAEFDSMLPDLQKAVVNANVVWPESILLGTSPLNGWQLILIDAKVDGDTLEKWMNVGYPTGEYDEFDQEIKIGFNLGWEVLAEENKIIDESLLLPYFDDVLLFDDNGSLIGTEKITSLKGKLQVWSGKKWSYPKENLGEQNDNP